MSSSPDEYNGQAARACHECRGEALQKAVLRAVERGYRVAFNREQAPQAPQGPVLVITVVSDGGKRITRELDIEDVSRSRMLLASRINERVDRLEGWI